MSDELWYLHIDEDLFESIMDIFRGSYIKFERKLINGDSGEALIEIYKMVGRDGKPEIEMAKVVATREDELLNAIYKYVYGGRNLVVFQW